MNKHLSLFTKLISTLQTEKAKKVMPYLSAGCICLCMCCTRFVFAADAKEIIELVVKVMGIIAGILGVLTTVMGAMAYAEAKSEGEGPAMAKAKNQIAGGAGLLIIAGVLEVFAGQLADMVTLSLD